MPLPNFGSESLAVQRSSFMKHWQPVKAYYLIIILLSLPTTSSPHITGDERWTISEQRQPAAPFSTFSIKKSPFELKQKVLFLDIHRDINTLTYTLT